MPSQDLDGGITKKHHVGLFTTSDASATPGQASPKTPTHITIVISASCTSAPRVLHADFDEPP